MTNRITEIESNFTAFKKDYYTKKEILPEFFALQEEMVNATFNNTHAERSGIRIWDVVRHLTHLNNDCNNIAEEMLQTFTKQSKQFENLIKAEISGAKGENMAYKSLQTARKDVRLLRNIELKNGEHRTEIDIVAVTGDMVFLLEVKNTAKDIVIDEKGNYCRVTYDGSLSFDKNIGEKMNEKEYLLREVLKKSGIENIEIESLVVFTNSNITVTNNYEYIDFCYLSQLPHIMDKAAGATTFSDKQIMKITQAILDGKCKESYPIEMDIDAFKSTFSTLLATLENAKAKQTENERIIAERKRNNPFAKIFKRLSKVACLMIK